MDTAGTHRHNHSLRGLLTNAQRKFTGTEVHFPAFSFRLTCFVWQPKHSYRSLNEGHLQQLKDQPGDGIFVLPTSLSWQFTEGGTQMIAAADYYLNAFKCPIISWFLKFIRKWSWLWVVLYISLILFREAAQINQKKFYLKMSPWKNRLPCKIMYNTHNIIIHWCTF